VIFIITDLALRQQIDVNRTWSTKWPWNYLF